MMDNESNATRRCEDDVEWAIHHQKAFYVERTSVVTAAGTENFVISTATVGVNLIPHGQIHIEASGAFSAKLYEVSQASTCTAINAINIDRNSAKVDSQTFEYCSVVTLGTCIWSTVAGGTFSIGSKADSTFFALKLNTKYLLQVTSVGASNSVVISYSFHEGVPT